jgi:hypothetical protein
MNTKSNKNASRIPTRRVICGDAVEQWFNTTLRTEAQRTEAGTPLHCFTNFSMKNQSQKCIPSHIALSGE